ncbi:MAG: hypothetical protein RJA81_1408 [Planctomycetota bacterium]
MSESRSSTEKRSGYWTARIRAWRSSISHFSEKSGDAARLVAFSPADFRPFASGTVPGQHDDPLRVLHSQQMVPNPNRIHPSWQAALKAKLPDHIRHFLHHLQSDQKTSGVLGAILDDCTNSLWSERLVGDLEPVSDEILPLQMLRGESRIQWYRHIIWCGKLKRALAGENSQNSRDRILGEREIPAEIHDAASESLAQFQKLTKVRLSSDAALGLVTLASLCHEVDHRRRQWVLQHFAMNLGMTLAPWLRIGKPALPERFLVMERWIAEQALGRVAGKTLDNRDLHFDDSDLAGVGLVTAIPAEPDPALLGLTQHSALEVTQPNSPSVISEQEENPAEQSSLITSSGIGSSELENLTDADDDNDIDREILSLAGLDLEQRQEILDQRPPENQDVAKFHAETEVETGTLPQTPSQSSSDAGLIREEFSQEDQLMDLEFEDSLEIPNIPAADSGLFDLDLELDEEIENLMADSLDGFPLPDESVAEAEDDLPVDHQDDSGSSFDLGDLQI